MDKFVIERLDRSKEYHKLIIRRETFEKLAEIKKRCNRNIADIVEAMVAFCSERLEIAAKDGGGEERGTGTNDNPPTGRTERTDTAGSGSTEN